MNFDICSDLLHKKTQSIHTARPVEYLRILLNILFHRASELLLAPLNTSSSCYTYYLTGRGSMHIIVNYVHKFIIARGEHSETLFLVVSPPNSIISLVIMT